MAQKKDSTPTPTPSDGWGVVVPPRKKGREGSTITEDDATALVNALDNAEDGQYVGAPDTYTTKGRAVAASVRVRRALLDYDLITDIKEVQSRVWEAGEEDFRFALRFRPAE